MITGDAGRTGGALEGYGCGQGGQALREGSGRRMTAEDKFKEAVLQRAGCLCEVCGKGDQVQVHHIEGRKKARVKTGGWPKEIAEGYPHIVLNGIALCLGGHRWVGKALRHSRPLLWGWLDFKYGKHKFRGKSYSEHFSGPGPWEGLL